MNPRILSGAAVAAGAALALTAAHSPVALGSVQPGLWEISGLPGAKAPVRQCIAAVPTLAQLEHRGKACSGRVVKDGPSWAVFEYSCGASGFGRSKIDVLTPRSLRIETQGISAQLPFRYLLQARRVGECSVEANAARH